MATSVLLACGLNEQLLPPFNFIREEAGVDASFLVTCILGQRVKIPNTSTILLCVHHTFQHYATSGMRLGFNLNAAREKGSLIVTEPLQDIADRLFASKYLKHAGEEVVHTVWKQIQGQIAHELDVNNRKSVTLIVDDLSAFINLGATENHLILLVRQLVAMASTNYEGRLSIVIKLNTCNCFEHLANNLETMANAEIQFNKLRSGNFREVDGRMVSIRLAKQQSSNSAGADGRTHKAMLYKVNERNVKIYAPGEVGIKL